MIGKLGYLNKGSRSNILYITHQCAIFVADSKEEHGNIVRWLVKYLKKTQDKGTIIKPNYSKGLKVYVEVDFLSSWNSAEIEDTETARSRHGYYIMYMECPILWKISLQGKISLSITESECTRLSYALRDDIPIMDLLQEMKKLNFLITDIQANIHCKVFEDSSGDLEMANIVKN